jgi:ribosomal protein L37AE/L43A
VKLGLVCPRCNSEIKPQRRSPHILREYSIRLYACIKCDKRMAVASFIVNANKAKWLERIYEEHTEIQSE